MRSEGKKRTLELSLIQGFSCVKSIYVLSLVVPPGIEPFASVYSKILIDYTFTALSFMKAIELALHQIHRFS